MEYKELSLYPNSAHGLFFKKYLSVAEFIHVHRSVEVGGRVTVTETTVDCCADDVIAFCKAILKELGE